MRTGLLSLALVAAALAAPAAVFDDTTQDVEEVVARDIDHTLNKLNLGGSNLATRNTIAELEAHLATLSESSNSLHARQTALGALLRIVLGALSSVTTLLSSSSSFDPSTALSMQSLMKQTRQQLKSMQSTLRTIPLHSAKLSSQSDQLSSLTTQVDSVYSDHMSELREADAATVTKQLQDFDANMASVQRAVSLL